MGSVAAVRVLHRRILANLPFDQRENIELELAAEHEKVSGGVQRAIEIGVVDAIIEPQFTRSEIAKVIAKSKLARGQHGNIPL
jgi:acetyl-CoA/propionyl-CoA carboxylase carboxyl transferase subunit